MQTIINVANGKARTYTLKQVKAEIKEVTADLKDEVLLLVMQKVQARKSWKTEELVAMLEKLSVSAAFNSIK